MKRSLLLNLALTLLIVACSRAEGPALEPEVLIQGAIERMTSTSGFHFIIDRQGAPAFIDPAYSIALRRMEGDYAAPDRVQAVVRVISPGLISNIEVISIGETQWETNPISGAWEQLPPEWGFNPALLFDNQIGFQLALQEDVSALVNLGLEELQEMPGQSLAVLGGELNGARLHAMSFGIIADAPLQMKLWINPQTFELARCQMTEPLEEGEDEPTIWTMDFWDFDLSIEIHPPSGYETTTP